MTTRVEPPGPGTLRPYTLPPVAKKRLSNGLTLLHANQPGSGLVTALAVIDAGTIRERPEEAGLATLTAESLDEGAGGRSGEELAWELERLGLELDTEASWDASWITATTKTELLDSALGILADIVQRPSFAEADVDRVKSEQLAVILQRRKEPRALANDLILRFLYGDAAAYGRPVMGIPERVRNLGRQHAIGYHGEHFGPARSALLLVGDIEYERASLAAQRAFGEWQGHGSVPSPPTAPASAPGGVIHIVDRPGSVQSEIRAAHAGVERRHPDYFALRVMNTILGGAFISRLNLNLRERSGFTYGVRSAFSFRRAPGPFLVQTAVATEVTDRALEEIMREIDLLRAEGANEEEVANAREYLAGVFPLELQTTEQIATRFSDLILYDLPDDYFQAYRNAIMNVTRDDVLRVARTHLQPQRLLFCIVGDAASVQAPLAATGRGQIEVHAVTD